MTIKYYYFGFSFHKNTHLYLYACKEMCIYVYVQKAKWYKAASEVDGNDSHRHQTHPLTHSQSTSLCTVGFRGFSVSYPMKILPQNDLKMDEVSFIIVYA